MTNKNVDKKDYSEDNYMLLVVIVTSQSFTLTCLIQ